MKECPNPNCRDFSYGISGLDDITFCPNCGTKLELCPTCKNCGCQTVSTKESCIVCGLPHDQALNQALGI